MLELFITGVDSKSNKILVTAGISAVMQSLGYTCGVYKPIETGVENFSKDINFIKRIDSFIKTYFSYQFKKDISPILSAASEGIVIEKSIIINDYQRIQNKNECLLIDGYSNLATPLSKDFLEEDVIKILNLPILLTVSAKNSDFNNVLLSVNRAKELGLELRGIVITEYSKETDNEEIKLLPKLIKEYTNTNILGIIKEIDFDITAGDLIAEVINNIDLEKVFKIKIAKLKKS